MTCSVTLGSFNGIYPPLTLQWPLAFANFCSFAKVELYLTGANMGSYGVTTFSLSLSRPYLSIHSSSKVNRIRCHSENNCTHNGTSCESRHHSGLPQTVKCAVKIFSRGVNRQSSQVPSGSSVRHNVRFQSFLT